MPSTLSGTVTYTQRPTGAWNLNPCAVSPPCSDDTYVNGTAWQMARISFPILPSSLQVYGLVSSFGCLGCRSGSRNAETLPANARSATGDELVIMRICSGSYRALSTSVIRNPEN